MLKSNLPVIIFAAIALPALSGFNVPPQKNKVANQPAQSPAVLAQSTSSPSAPSNQGTISLQDQQFVLKAAQGGMAEVELGSLASQKASSSAVKNFGQQMVQDHTQANNQLKQLASQKEINVPKDAGAQNKATKARLSKLSGATFDRELMNQMVIDHQKTVSLFEQEAQQGQDPDLKAWAAQTLPILKDHLRLALSTQSDVTHRSSTK